MNRQPRRIDTEVPFEKLVQVAERDKRALDEVIAIVRRHHAAEVAVRAAEVPARGSCTFH